MKKIFVFKGGLGNQLFQYLFMVYSQKAFGIKYVWMYDGMSHNGMELEKYFQVSLPDAAPAFSQKLHDYCVKIRRNTGWKTFLADDESRDIRKKIIISGYWQDKRYYKPGILCFKDLLLSEQNAALLQQIQNPNSVAIHVRRGDYLLPQYAPRYAGICSEDYYKKAIDICQEKIAEPLFFVFSDDVEWVIDNLRIENAVYVDWNRGDDSIYDMYLMSHAYTNIIANSSFSYWAARLNQNKNLVIYPTQWYNAPFVAPDIFPKDWIGINP